jgi:hypothetical protein
MLPTYRPSLLCQEIPPAVFAKLYTQPPTNLATYTYILLTGKDATDSENQPPLADVRNGLFFSALFPPYLYSSRRHIAPFRLWSQLDFEELATSLREAKDLGEKIAFARTIRKALAIGSRYHPRSNPVGNLHSFLFVVDTSVSKTRIPSDFRSHGERHCTHFNFVLKRKGANCRRSTPGACGTD